MEMVWRVLLLSLCELNIPYLFSYRSDIDKIIVIFIEKVKIVDFSQLAEKLSKKYYFV